MKKHRYNSLTVDQQKQLLNICETIEDQALFKLALTTGIRREDIVNIDIGNIDFDNHNLKFWQQKKKNFHTVPLTDETSLVLKRYINTLPKRQKLFTFSGRTAYNKLQYYMKKMGIEGISFHDLRRTFIKTGMNYYKMNPKAIAQIVDDTIDTVMYHYNNLDPHELKNEVNKMV